MQDDPIFPIDPPERPKDFQVEDHTGDITEVTTMMDYAGDHKVYLSIAGCEDALCVALTVPQANQLSQAIAEHAEYIHTLRRRKDAGYDKE